MRAQGGTTAPGGADYTDRRARAHSNDLRSDGAPTTILALPSCSPTTFCTETDVPLSTSSRSAVSILIATIAVPEIRRSTSW